MGQKETSFWSKCKLSTTRTFAHCFHNKNRVNRKVNILPKSDGTGFPSRENDQRPIQHFWATFFHYYRINVEKRLHVAMTFEHSANK
jgi:hypothetical protein